MWKHSSGETAGRKIFHRWSLWGFEYRSDLIASDYMRRWTLKTPWGMLRLHHILRSDSREHLHDHPMDFVSFILKGGYIEHRPDLPSKRYAFGNVLVRRAEDLHALELFDEKKGAWTFVLSTLYRRDWGFQTEDGWIKAGDYDKWKEGKSGWLPTLVGKSVWA